MGTIPNRNCNFWCIYIANATYSVELLGHTFKQILIGRTCNKCIFNKLK